MAPDKRTGPVGDRAGNKAKGETGASVPRCTHCNPVTVRLNRRARRMLGRTVETFHADQCPFNQSPDAPGYQAAGRVRSPFRGGQDG